MNNNKWYKYILNEQPGPGNTRIGRRGRSRLAQDQRSMLRNRQLDFILDKIFQQIPVLRDYFTQISKKMVEVWDSNLPDHLRKFQLSEDSVKEILGLLLGDTILSGILLVIRNPGVQAALETLFRAILTRLPAVFAEPLIIAAGVATVGEFILFAVATYYSYKEIEKQLDILSKEIKQFTTKQQIEAENMDEAFHNIKFYNNYDKRDLVTVVGRMKPEEKTNFIRDVKLVYQRDGVYARTHFANVFNYVFDYYPEWIPQNRDIEFEPQEIKAEPEIYAKEPQQIAQQNNIKESLIKYLTYQELLLANRIG